jgi:hypothetical protein
VLACVCVARDEGACAQIWRIRMRKRDREGGREGGEGERATTGRVREREIASARKG